MSEVRATMERLEAETQKTFGRGDKPLLVSVRSGAAYPCRHDGHRIKPWSQHRRT